MIADGKLRRSALAMAVLASLIAFGVSDQQLVPAPLREIADELDSSYDTVYKRVRTLADMGYVQLTRLVESGQRRLFMRLVWPQTTPKKSRKPRTRKQG